MKFKSFLTLIILLCTSCGNVEKVAPQSDVKSIPLSEIGILNEEFSKKIYESLKGRAREAVVSKNKLKQTERETFGLRCQQNERPYGTSYLCLLKKRFWTQSTDSTALTTKDDMLSLEFASRLQFLLNVPETKIDKNPYKEISIIDSVTGLKYSLKCELRIKVGPRCTILDGVKS